MWHWTLPQSFLAFLLGKFQNVLLRSATSALHNLSYRCRLADSIAILGWKSSLSIWLSSLSVLGLFLPLSLHIDGKVHNVACIKLSS